MDLIEETRDALREWGLQWKPLAKKVIQKLRTSHPGLPADFVRFLSEVGAGSFAGRYRIYGAPAHPDEVYDPETAEPLKGLLIFGDDFLGYSAAFSPAEGWRVVEIDPNGEVVPKAKDFTEFMLKRLARMRGKK